MFLHILGTLPFIERTQKDSCISLKKLAQENVCFAHDLVTFGFWDVLPGIFQPYIDTNFLENINIPIPNTDYWSINIVYVAGIISVAPVLILAKFDILVTGAPVQVPPSSFSVHSPILLSK